MEVDFPFRVRPVLEWRPAYPKSDGRRAQWVVTGPIPGGVAAQYGMVGVYQNRITRERSEVVHKLYDQRENFFGSDAKHWPPEIYDEVYRRGDTETGEYAG